MKKLFPLFFFSPLFAVGQTNLVPNPSFETYDTCPYNPNQIYFASPWFQPERCMGNTTNSSSSDYFNSCSISMGVPYNPGGFQFARTGNAYAGIFFYANNGTREYIEVKLLDSMIAGKKYCVEFYVSLALPFTVATDDLHIYFSTDSLLDAISFPCLDVISVTPSITNTNGNYITDTLNWILVSGQYIATGGEKFFTIGNFYDNANTDTIGSGSSAYYFIDDVSVIDCGWSGLTEYNQSSNVTVSPNPSNDFFKINVSNAFEFEITVFDILGQHIYPVITKDRTSFIVDIGNQEKGTYIISLQSNSEFYFKKIILTK